MQPMPNSYATKEQSRCWTRTYSDPPSARKTNFLQRRGYLDTLLPPTCINSERMRQTIPLCAELHLQLQDAARRHECLVTEL